MRILSKLLFVAFILHFSCATRSSEPKNDNSLMEAKKLLHDYEIRRDTSSLAKAYELVESDGTFDGEGLSDKNYDLVFSLLMYLRKYEELESLLNNSNYPVREKEMTLNVVKALKMYSADSVKAFRLIEDNLSLIESKIEENQLDSLLYIDYFVMYMYRNGRSQSLQRVDSFKLVDSKFSNTFHDQILRDVIEEYPNEFLFPSLGK